MPVSMRKDLVLDAREQTLYDRETDAGLICHSDGGAQYMLSPLRLETAGAPVTRLRRAGPSRNPSAKSADRFRARGRLVRRAIPTPARRGRRSAPPLSPAGPSRRPARRIRGRRRRLALSVSTRVRRKARSARGWQARSAAAYRERSGSTRRCDRRLGRPLPVPARTSCPPDPVVASLLTRKCVDDTNVRHNRWVHPEPPPPPRHR